MKKVWIVTGANCSSGAILGCWLSQRLARWVEGRTILRVAERKSLVDIVVKKDRCYLESEVSECELHIQQVYPDIILVVGFYTAKAMGLDADYFVEQVIRFGMLGEVHVPAYEIPRATVHLGKEPSWWDNGKHVARARRFLRKLAKEVKGE